MVEKKHIWVRLGNEIFQNMETGKGYTIVVFVRKRNTYFLISDQGETFKVPASLILDLTDVDADDLNGQV